MNARHQPVVRCLEAFMSARPEGMTGTSVFYSIGIESEYEPLLIIEQGVSGGRRTHFVWNRIWVRGIPRAAAKTRIRVFWTLPESVRNESELVSVRNE